MIGSRYVALLPLLLLGCVPVWSQKAYLTTDTGLAVIDLATGSTITTIPATYANRVRLTPDGRRAYVVQNTSPASLLVIDTANDTIVHTLNLPPGVYQFGDLVFNPTGTRAYLSSVSIDSVLVIDTSTNTVVATVPVGNFPDGIAVTPDGTRAYVASALGYSISVIDTSTNNVSGTIQLPEYDQVGDVVISPDGSRAYFTIRPLQAPGPVISSIQVVDIPSNRLGSRISLGEDYPSLNLALSPDGARAYHADVNGNTLQTIDLIAGRVLATVTLPPNPGYVALNRDGSRAYVVNHSGMRGVSVVDTTTNTVVGTLTTLPVYGIAVSTVNASPVARCSNITATAGPTCSAQASINNGSFDPDASDTLSVLQSPAGPYGKGTTTVTLSATDNYGSSASCTATVTVNDTTSPSLTAPGPVTVDATSASGAVLSNAVLGSATATDNCGIPAITRTGVPTSNQFPIGITTVTYTASDSSTNSIATTQTITVRGLAAQITNLTNTVNGLAVPGGIKTSLLATLSAAQAASASGNRAAACGQMQAFILKVTAQSGKAISAAQANELIATATRIRAILGC